MLSSGVCIPVIEGLGFDIETDRDRRRCFVGDIDPLEEKRSGYKRSGYKRCGYARIEEGIRETDEPMRVIAPGDKRRQVSSGCIRGEKT